MPDRVQEVLSHVGANIARRRRALDITQEELAEAVGLDSRFIQKIERATTPPSIASVVAIADALEIAVSALFRPVKITKAKPGRPKKKRSRN